MAVNFASNQPRDFETELIFLLRVQTSLGNVLIGEIPVRTRHIRKVYRPTPFDIGDTELSRELEIYYQAIHSYPDCFARTRVSFQEHLLSIMGVVHPVAQGAEPECMKPAS